MTRQEFEARMLLAGWLRDGFNTSLWFHRGLTVLLRAPPVDADADRCLHVWHEACRQLERARHPAQDPLLKMHFDTPGETDR